MDTVYPLLSDACENEFSLTEIKILHSLLVDIIPYQIGDGKYKHLLDSFNHLKRKYHELDRRSERKDLDPLKCRFSYLKAIIKAEKEA